MDYDAEDHDPVKKEIPETAPEENSKVESED